MKTSRHFFICLLLSAFIGICRVPVLSAAEPPSKRADLYDTKADGKALIEAALKKARAENKRVILKFGANWCIWCHRLSNLLENNAEVSTLLKNNYVLVLIDVDKGHNAEVIEQYGNPVRFGLPVLVVLESDGKLLTTQDTGKLEEGNQHSVQKVKEFLEHWRKTKTDKSS